MLGLEWGGAWKWAHLEIGGRKTRKPKLASQICCKTVLSEDCVLLLLQGPETRNSGLRELSLFELEQSCRKGIIANT